MYTLLCFLLVYCLLSPAFQRNISGVLFVVRGSARVPCVCSSSYSLSVWIGLTLAIAYRSYRCASGLYTIFSHIDFSHFLVVTFDYYQCLMIVIVGMCMGFKYDSQIHFVTILCFALKHKFELAYYKHVISVYKKLHLYDLYWFFETLHVQSRDISIRLLVTSPFKLV